jgi:hypothetical protein
MFIAVPSSAIQFAEDGKMNPASGCGDKAANPARRGRQFGWRKPPLEDRPHTETSVFDIDRWCRDGDFSRTGLYAEWTAGRGPKRVRIGGKIKIIESPREYCERIALDQAAGHQAI